MISKFRNKKANVVLDVMMVLIVIFVFALISIFGGYIFNNINEEIQADEDFNTLTKTTLAEVESNYTSSFDGVIVFGLILLWIMAIVASFMIDSHPAFFIISLILLVFVLIAAGVLSNVYEDLSLDDDLDDTFRAFSMTSFIMTHLVEFLVVIIVTVSISLYAKSRFT